jgi:hypothetical protein
MERQDTRVYVSEEKTDVSEKSYKNRLIDTHNSLNPRKEADSGSPSTDITYRL